MRTKLFGVYDRYTCFVTIIFLILLFLILYGKIRKHIDKDVDKETTNGESIMSMSIKEMTEEQIVKAIGSTWFELNDDDREDGKLLFETRENGNVGDESYGEEDYNEAVRILPMLRSAFPRQNFEGSVCDEFVIITITDKC